MQQMEEPLLILHGRVYQVEDDVVDCNTIQEEKCEQETVGYATQNKCTKWPRWTLFCFIGAAT